MDKNRKKKSANIDEMKMLEVSFELNLNEAIGDIADLGNVDTTTGWEIIDMSLKELSEGKSYEHQWGK